ncbi:MAG: 2Fe-2S iron-sulfur cluster-binding protein [Gallionella sp.]|nr:2Fe-2S iron-sulfur cluster-binding protein [Gallionella sp.]
MPYLKYQGKEVFARKDENVLDAMLRSGVDIPFSCRSGVCHICVQRCTQGEIPPLAQNGLRPELREQGYFMTCKCVPLTDMEIVPPSDLFTTTLVHSKELLTPKICKLLIEPPQDFTYRAGQYINVRNPKGVVRSYSLASLPATDYFLELHIQLTANGEMSPWIFDTLSSGDEIEIQRAEGECCYQTKIQTQPMLLIGTGTGLSPLLGVIRDALHQQHQGEIHLYHGSRTLDHLYLHNDLRQLEQQHPNFHYHPCLSGSESPPEGMNAGRADVIAFAELQNLHDWQVYLTGLTEMVEKGRLIALEHGAALSSIHTDAFSITTATPSDKPVQPSTRDYPPPDPVLWKALGEGELLMAVLRDFYGRVFQDPRLSSFFEGVTKQRSIEKQYLFTRQILTGEKIYFGERPRNSHHWMVISDELFDYRAEIMVSCLREHGLAEDMVHRFREVEEFFRAAIVKSSPFARVMGDVEVPFEGFGEITLDVGTLCDVCEREVSIGEKVIYHLRLGKIYCSDCSSQHHHEVS